MSTIDRPPSPNGTRRLRPSPTLGPGRRRAELVVGLLLVVGGALGALVVATSGRNRVPVVSLAREVSRGEVIVEDHLDVTYVNADQPMAHVDADERDAVVGRAALADLDAGTIVTPAQFGDPAGVLAAGEGTIGLSLEPGQLPALPLSPGDRVSVVGVAAGEAAAPASNGPVIDAAEVVAAEQVDDQSSSWWVSLRASEADALMLAGVAASGSRVQLVLVGR